MVFDPKLDIIGVLIEDWNPHLRYEMTQSFISRYETRAGVCFLM